MQFIGNCLPAMTFSCDFLFRVIWMNSFSHSSNELELTVMLKRGRVGKATQWNQIRLELSWWNLLNETRVFSLITWLFVCLQLRPLLYSPPFSSFLARRTISFFNFPRFSLSLFLTFPPTPLQPWEEFSFIYRVCVPVSLLSEFVLHILAALIELSVFLMLAM